MHTPEEAKDLWCPMSRIAVREKLESEGALTRQNAAVVGGVNKSARYMQNRIPGDCLCIADRCAMWRWEHTTASVPVVKDAGANKYTTYEVRTVRTHGYCGLAPLHTTAS